MIDRAKLERCRRLKHEADYCEERMKEIVPKVTSRTDLFSRGSGWGQPTESMAVARMALDEYLHSVLDEYKALIEEITAASMKLDPVYRSIIVMRYIDCIEWPDMAEALCYSESHLYVLHRQAIQAISEA